MLRPVSTIEEAGAAMAKAVGASIGRHRRADGVPPLGDGAASVDVRLVEAGAGALLALPVLVFALLCSALPAAAQDTTTTSAQSWVADGMLNNSSRSFQASDEHDGTFYLHFDVIEFDTDLHAENGIHPFVSATLDSVDLTAPWNTLAPPVGDSTLAYRGQVIREGYTVDAAILVVRDGRYLHSWLALGRGFAPNPLLDLATLAEPFFPDSYASSTIPESARLLDRLPALSDLPPGFALAQESE